MQRPVAPTQRDHSELMAAKINRAQQIQRRAQAARRRLTLLIVQFAVGMVLLAAAMVSSLSWLWVLVPVVTVAATLSLGARAAQAGRRNDQRAVERIRALEMRPAKGHRMSAGEKKYAQINAKVKDNVNSQVHAETETEDKNVNASEKLESTEPVIASVAEVATEQTAREGLGKLALAALAAASRRTATFREYFVRGEAEIAAKAREESTEVTAKAKTITQDQTETSAEKAVLADKAIQETEGQESKQSAQAEVTPEIEVSVETPDDKTDTVAVKNTVSSEAESNLTDRSWTPAPMPKPIYALKPRLARRDIDASELLAEHLAARGSAPYRPSRPHPHTEESLTTAQLVAQSKPVDVEAILDTRRIAN